MSGDPGSDLAARVRKLERAVFRLGALLVALFPLVPSSIAYVVADRRLGFSQEGGFWTALAVYFAGGLVFWKWIGHNIGGRERTISANAQRILDEAGVDTARTVYARQSNVLPQDADAPVQLDGGQVRLGELGEWLHEKETGRYGLSAGTIAVVIGVIAIILVAGFGYLVIRPR
jgi:hypothetical protein